MTSALAILFLASTLTGADIERDGVRIEAAVKAQIFSWTVHNLDAQPITAFQVHAHNVYNPIIPDDWQWELDGDRFRTWTEQTRSAVRPGREETFSLRVGSHGAVLGLVPLSLGFDDGSTLRFDQAWGPVAKPATAIILVPLTITCLALIHLFFLVRRERNKTPRAAAVNA